MGLGVTGRLPHHMYITYLSLYTIFLNKSCVCVCACVVGQCNSYSILDNNSD